MTIDNLIWDEMILKINQLQNYQEAVNKMQELVTETVNGLISFISAANTHQLYLNPPDITALEAVKLAKHTTCDHHNIACEISKYCDSHREYPDRPDIDNLLKISAIWTAGRLQGIREERRRVFRK